MAKLVLKFGDVIVAFRTDDLRGTHGPGVEFEQISKGDEMTRHTIRFEVSDWNAVDDYVRSQMRRYAEGKSCVSQK